jgi:hypothetical protein
MAKENGMRLYREIFRIAAMVLAPLDSASAAASDQWAYAQSFRPLFHPNIHRPSTRQHRRSSSLP